jgi:hypothetical protein
MKDRERASNATHPARGKDSMRTFIAAALFAGLAFAALGARADESWTATAFAEAAHFPGPDASFSDWCGDLYGAGGDARPFYATPGSDALTREQSSSAAVQPAEWPVGVGSTARRPSIQKAAFLAGQSVPASETTYAIGRRRAEWTIEEALPAPSGGPSALSGRARTFLMLIAGLTLMGFVARRRI